MRLALHRPVFWLLTVLCLCLGTISAEARIIALLFDTSGSMKRHFNLPSYGVRLLAGTIDGRAGFDQLLVMNFNHYSTNYGLSFPSTEILSRYAGADVSQIVDIKITNGVEHQKKVKDLEDVFKSSDAGTPYGPIEVMLDRIVRELVVAPDGEEVVFVVVSDGSYHDKTDDFKGGRQVSYMRRQFEDFKERIEEVGGALRAEFLLIDVDGAQEEKVRDQRVRDTLLEVFNGRQRDAQGQLAGARTVSSPNQLWEALKDIIATVAGTDREAQHSFVRYSGQAIEVESPLSISRMVIVSSSAVGSALPTRQSDTFGVQPTDRRRIKVSMRDGDAAFDGSPRRQGLVEHLWFQNAVPAGTYSLQFDAPVDEDVFLLFETSSIIDLEIFDLDGNEVLPDGQGVYTIYKDRRYRFESQILDRLDIAGQPFAVDLDALPPSLTMLLSLGGQPGLGTSSMLVDPAADLGSFEWTPRATGEVTAFSRASAGILSPVSERLMITVLDPNTVITITPLRSDVLCSVCTHNEILFQVTGKSEDVLVGEFDVEANGAFDGAISFGPSVIPKGFELRDQAGNPIDPNAVMEFGANESRSFQLWRKGNLDPVQLAKGAAEVEIAVAPVGQWMGSPIQRVGTVLLELPDLMLDLVAVSMPLTPGEVDGLKVPGGELLLGQFSAQFGLIDIVIPPNPERLDEATTITSNRFIDHLISFKLDSPDPQAVGFNALDVRPGSRFWCLCWVFLENSFLGTSRRQVDVVYRVQIEDVVVQQANAVVPMEFPVGRGQGGLSCLWNLILMFLVYVFLRGLWALFTTHRFPTGARVEIVGVDNRVSYKPLDRGNTFWIKAWFAWAIGNPDEKRLVEGLKLKAARNGALLDISGGTPNWTLDRLGSTFTELKEIQPKKTEYKIQWDDRFESISPPGRFLYLRRGRKT